MRIDDAARPFVCIGLCTRGRGKELHRLLDCLRSLTLPDEDLALSLLIVDNNDGATVMQDDVGRQIPFRCTVHHESEAGLVNARNALLDMADEQGADWLIGIDDDVWMNSDWLNNWWAALSSGKTDLYVGASCTVFDGLQSRLLPKELWLNRTDAAPFPQFTTANFAISRQIFSKTSGHGMRFDHRFNFSGGEDAEFAKRAERLHGIPLLSNSAAIVSEERLGKRKTFTYHLRRCVRDQVNGYRVSHLHRTMGIFTPRRSMPAMLAMRTNESLIKGLGYMLRGIVLLPTKTTVGLRTIGSGLSLLARVYAILPYLLGKSSREYQPISSDNDGK